MKYVLLFSFYFFFFGGSFAQTKIAKTLDPQKSSKVNIIIPNHSMEHQIWEEGAVQIDIQISVNLPTVALEGWIAAGRYELLGKKVEDDYLISMPNLKIPVSVANKTIEESIVVKITSPQYFAMNDQNILYKDVNEEAIRGRSDTREEIEAIIKKMKEIREPLDVQIKVVSTATNQTIDLATFLLTVRGEALTIDQVVFPSLED
ncbi:hypothetical protein [Aureispira anguillae]|uniref:DUF4230 domain-containing protein n=1 Tax=Aureispira anguillae TaxID=2864201 RepID=A0A915YBD2_9BACT|nr:hypothetical protein [Aureispira anguillae]BDS09961.1 hypothetical protein AsAng_0006660 [Aureispira anguillae]